MKQLSTMVLLAVLSTVAHSQVTCQTSGTTTYCNGSLGGSTISDNGAFNSNLAKISAAQYGPNAVALQQQAAAQAQLANQQAEYVRQQSLALQRQQQAEAFQRQQEAEPVNNRREPEPQNSQREAEPLDRSQEAEALRSGQWADWYESYKICLKRLPPAQSLDGATAIQARCKQDTSATSTAPQDIGSSAAAISTVKGSAMSQSSQSSRFRQKWSALDDALANGVITKAEYDKKLSALLEQHRREPDDR